MREKNFGLNAYQLKMIGIIFMVIDHIHQMFHMNGIPIWFTMLGRIVAPIFIFMSAEGYYYTKSKIKYMMRLWIAYVIMAICSNLIQKQFPLDEVVLMNSMFGTLFLCLLYMFATDNIIGGFKNKKIKNILLGIVIAVIPLALNIAVGMVMNNDSLFKYAIILVNIVPLPIFVEGGYLWIVLAVSLHLLRDRNKIIRLMPIVLVSLLMVYIGNYIQALMITSVVPLYFYNSMPGKKGSKYFFYIFYPAHIYILYLISYFINK